MAVKQQLMNTTWTTGRNDRIDYAAFIEPEHRFHPGDSVRVVHMGDGDDRPFRGMPGRVAAVSPDGRHVELEIKDGAHVFHVAELASNVERRPGR